MEKFGNNETPYVGEGLGNEEIRSLLDHFVKTFSSAYTVDLKNDTFEILHMNHQFKQVFTMNGKREDMNRFIENHVHPDDRENIYLLTDNKKISERLKTESEIRFTIREQYNGKERIMHAIIMRLSDNYHAAVGFLDVTEEFEKERKTREQLETAIALANNYRQAVLSHALISLIVNLSKDILISGVWVDDEGKELNLEEIIGLKVPCSYDEYIKRWNEKFVNKDYEEEFHKLTDRKELLKSFEENKKEITFDYNAKTVSGHQVYLRRVIDMSIAPDSKDIIAYTSVKDISEAKRAELEILNNNKIINKLASRYNDVLIANTKTGTVQAIRITGEKYGVTKERIDGLSFEKALEIYVKFNVFEEDKGDFIENVTLVNIAKDLQINKEYLYHFRGNEIDKKTHYYYLKAAKVSDSSDNELIVVGFANEDDEMEKKNILENALIAAENSSQAKTTFLFNMSHDIRTPMNAIIGFTDMALKRLDDINLVKDYLEKVKVSSNHLLSLINDVLDMSRVESGKVKIDETPNNISMIMDNLMSITSENAKSHGLMISCKCEEELENVWVLVDRLRLMRVLTNIISNSIKYTNEGGKIDVSVEVLSKNEKSIKVRYVVKDSGIGMSEEFLKQLFEPFARAENSTKSGVTGTGLGMAITKSLVELMNGKIDVKSKLGEGTTVEIVFENKITESIKVDDVKTDYNQAEFVGKKLLLVEDNELNRELALTILNEEGFDVITAEDGDIAVDIVKNSKPGDIDLVLMDIQMPTMNGYEATKIIRSLENPVLANIPIFAMTANAFEEDRINAIKAGMNGHLTKPINVPILLKTLSEVLKK